MIDAFVPLGREPCIDFETLFPTTRFRATVAHGRIREHGVRRVPLETINYLYGRSTIH